MNEHHSTMSSVALPRPRLSLCLPLQALQLGHSSILALPNPTLNGFDLKRPADGLHAILLMIEIMRKAACVRERKKDCVFICWRVSATEHIKENILFGTYTKAGLDREEIVQSHATTGNLCRKRTYLLLRWKPLVEWWQQEHTSHLSQPYLHALQRLFWLLSEKERVRRRTHIMKEAGKTPLRVLVW